MQLTHKGQIVATTAMLAQYLGATEDALKVNFNSNKTRYTEGEHYFLLKGAELKEFKNYTEKFGSVQNLQVSNPYAQISPMTRQIYLWTKKGAFNHVKSLGTDEAWDEFQKMSDTYFKMESVIAQIAESANPQEVLLLEHTKRPIQISNAKEANTQSFLLGGKELCIDWNRKVSFHFTGYLPNELKELAKQKGVPSKFRSSGKEVIRYYRPDKAACISVADFFHSAGMDDNEAINLAQTALPVIAKLIELKEKNQQLSI